MLSKKNRVGRKEITQIFKSGRFVNSLNLSFKYILTKKNTPPQISFIVPKSVSKSAVKRNLLRRRGYDALNGYIADFPAGFIGAFVFKKAESDISILQNEIKEIYNKIH